MQIVERLAVLDGVVVAVGRCDPSDRPVIVYEGEPLPNQSFHPYTRPDGKPGFRCVAVVGPKPDNSQIAVSFRDGPTVRRNLPNISDAHAMLNEFGAMIADNPGSSMIEIGSRARSGTVYKTRFPSLGRYAGVDIMEGPNVDIVADAHTLSRSVTEQFDYGFSISVFEHLIMPWVAAFELNKVMKPGGVIYIQSHPTYPLHEEPWDFFRFSANAWKGLFNAFTGFEIIKTGYSLEASIVPMNAANGAMQGMDMSKTFLVSAVMARKVSEPSVDWAVDPSTVADIQYSHAARA